MPQITLIMFPMDAFRSTNGWFPLFVREDNRRRSNWDEIQDLVQQGNMVTIRRATADEMNAAKPDMERCTELARSGIAEPKST